MGFLDKKIRNQKYRNKENQKSKKQSNRLSVDENQVTPQRSSNVTNTPNRNSYAKGNRKSRANEMDIKSGLQFLKSVVVTEKNTENIHSVLIITAAHRREMMKVDKFDFLEHFPILFTNPDFVSCFLDKKKICYSRKY